MKREKVNIYVIAKEAGVSPATVSRVLTKNAKVSKEKEEKVNKLIEKYDFKPNAIARNLLKDETKTIGVLLPDIRNPFHATLAVACEIAANNMGYTLMLFNYLGDNQLEEEKLEIMMERRVDAIVQIGGKVDELLSDDDYAEKINRIMEDIPIVITGKLDGADCYQVNIDEGQSMELAMEYLVELGHVDIMLVGGRKDVKSTHDKRIRFRQMLRRYNIEFTEDMIVESVYYDVNGGYECINKILSEGEKQPTAIIAINDFTALGIVKALNKFGLKVPEDISVISFDNTYIAEMGSPRLTSVGYDYELWGETIVKAAIAAIRGESPARTQLIKSEIAIRESCRSIL